MSIQEISAEQLAELFHHYHQALGLDFGSANETGTERWEDVAPGEKRRMVAAAHLALLELSTSEQDRSDSSRYFAKPGEAEWGC